MIVVFILVLLCTVFLIILMNRYFDWNRETVKMTGDRVNKVCTSSYNYIPFYYIFGSVCFLDIACLIT